MAEPQLRDASKGWGLDTFKLKHPFTLAGAAHSELSVRVPTGADIEAYLRAPERSFRALAAKLVDAPEAVLDAMRGNDYSRLLKHVGEFVAGTD